jgi:molecular chaperone DnaK (HSP70)
MTNDNKKLGEFTLKEIQRVLYGIPNFDVTFEIDDNNMLSVTALETATGNIMTITIKRDNGDLDVEKILKETSIENNKNKKFKGKSYSKI